MIFKNSILKGLLQQSVSLQEKKNFRKVKMKNSGTRLHVLYLRQRKKKVKKAIKMCDEV